MTRTRFVIKGPGLVRAIQEGVSAKKTMVIAYDYDNAGRLLRVGYFFKEKGKQEISQSKINWFSPDEIQVSIENTSARDKTSLLDVDFHHPKDNERHFLLSLTLDKYTQVILRNLFRIDKKSVTGFVIQVEICFTAEGKKTHKPVVRYDHAHGFIHRDMIASDDRKTKYKLNTQDTKDAIVSAVEEIRENFNLWLHQLGYKTMSAEVINQPQLNKELDRAKSKLLELHDNPDKTKTMQSTFVQLKERPDHLEQIWPPVSR
jgi:hypothetical protein